MKLTSEDLIIAGKVLTETSERFTRSELGEQLQSIGKAAPATTLKAALKRAVDERWFEVVDVASQRQGQPWLYRLTNPEENARQAMAIARLLGGTVVDGKVTLEVPAAMILAVKLNIWP